MKRPFLTSALALAITVGATAPAHADDKHDRWIDVQSSSWTMYGGSFTTNPVSYMIALLLPAIQSARIAR